MYSLKIEWTKRIVLKEKVMEGQDMLHLGTAVGEDA